jgi:anti-sigma regulatory factor (Ser/Thr protein kinase)
VHHRVVWLSPASGMHPKVEHRLPYEPAAVSAARRLVSDFAEDRLSEMRLYELQLMVSEVVTNAVMHGAPEPDGNIGLRLEGDQGVLRAAVTDGGAMFTFDLRSIEDTRRDEHFGLVTVDRLADRWGLSLDGKKAIWLEVDTPQAV